MEKPAYQTLIEFWAKIEADINYGPTSLEMILALEDQYSIKLPPAFRDYILHACPIGEDQSDPELTIWWQLQRIQSWKQEFGRASYFSSDPALAKDVNYYLIFADSFAWMSAWAICCKPGENYGRIIQLSETNEFVSNSFDEFVLAYIKHMTKACSYPNSSKP